MTAEMRMVYEMALAEWSTMTEEYFMEYAFDEECGIRVSCNNADIIAKMNGAIDDRDEDTIYWKGMIITYDPYEDWGAEEL